MWSICCRFIFSHVFCMFCSWLFCTGILHSARQSKSGIFFQFHTSASTSFEGIFHIGQHLKIVFYHGVLLAVWALSSTHFLQYSFLPVSWTILSNLQATCCLVWVTFGICVGLPFTNLNPSRNVVCKIWNLVVPINFSERVTPFASDHKSLVMCSEILFIFVWVCPIASTYSFKIGNLQCQSRKTSKEVLHAVDKSIFHSCSTNLLCFFPRCLLRFQQHLLARGFLVLSMAVLDEEEFFDLRLHKEIRILLSRTLLDIWHLWREFLWYVIFANRHGLSSSLMTHLLETRSIHQDYSFQRSLSKLMLPWFCLPR